MILLDTHTILWILMGDPRLSQKASELIEQETSLAFSMVSLWEIGIKLGLQRPDFKLKSGWSKSIPRTLIEQEITRLDIQPIDCQTVSTLPLHHRDPFDRMLIAQAIHYEAAILSIDPQLDAYPIRRIW
jgi:PIN domain nuclease of toxin-antitoxin system